MKFRRGKYVPLRVPEGMDPKLHQQTWLGPSWNAAVAADEARRAALAAQASLECLERIEELMVLLVDELVPTDPDVEALRESVRIGQEMVEEAR